MYNGNFLKDLYSQIRYANEDYTESKGIKLQRSWQGSCCKSFLTNETQEPVSIKEVVLFKGILPVNPDTRFYGEGYNMLSQYGGRLNNPENIGEFSDKDHYRLPQTEGFFTLYNLIMLFPEQTEAILIGYTSCRRFNGEIRISGNNFEIVVITEGLLLKGHETWELEELMFLSGTNWNDLFEIFGQRVEINHPRLTLNEVPTGWCSWYCYGPDITERTVMDNMDAISQKVPELKYIQIDDGYQQYMGDWLVPSPQFPDIQSLCLTIKEKGFEPAIWVAPFIAEKDSELFKQHPDWFIKDDNGNPLPSDQVTFGGWRCGPWYMLDCTHPEALEYIRTVFKTMRQEWQCKYFKLDATVWAAMPFGHRYDPALSVIETHRKGMEALIEGAGADSFILGSNAAMWPSFGLVHGMRITGDTTRKWFNIKQNAKECFWRNWQHNKLWINDPDCVLTHNIKIEIIGPDGTINYSGDIISDEEYQYHTTHKLASGGMILSSDRMQELDSGRICILKKLLPPVNTAAEFDDTTFRIGRIYLPDRQIICAFNREDEAIDLNIPLAGKYRIVDFWTDEALGVVDGQIELKNMKPHSAMAFTCYTAENEYGGEAYDR